MEELNNVLQISEACENGADVAVGSRYVKGGNVSNWDFKRILLSYLASYWVTEKSLFIPNIIKTDIIKLGELFEQYSVIYKDSNEFVEIGTNEISGIGKVITNFIKQGWNKNIQINSDLTKKFFSRLAKGSHRDDKFIFNIEDSYLLEMDEKSFNEMYGESFGKKKQKRYIRLL
jgi:hypothetical protein